MLREVERPVRYWNLWYGDCEFAGEVLCCIAIIEYSGELLLDVTIEYGATYEDIMESGGDKRNFICRTMKRSKLGTPIKGMDTA